MQSQSSAVQLPGGYNILFVLTDQERYFEHQPVPLPGRERLQKSGVSFINHWISSCVCSPSRSVIYTGQHIQNTKVFDNAGFPWQPDLDPQISTIGKVMRALGYHSAYQGKWHLNGAMEHENKEWEVTESFMDLMDQYGFSDYIGVGDLIGHGLGGYKFDGLTTSTAVRWLRGRGQPLNQQGKPWYLSVDLVNPHDVMFYNTDELGQPVQEGTNLLSPINREPDHEIYRAEWNQVPLPESWRQPLDAPGRPRAHTRYRDSNAHMVGMIPNEEARWRRFQNYYFNCIRDVDRNVETLLNELDELGLREKTIVIMTADHGELGGSHGGLWGKGATAYQEQNHVPFVISHPAYPGGVACSAVTSHVDLVPTIVGLTGKDPKEAGSLLDKAVGKDFSPLLASPASASLSAVRDGALYSFNMLMYLDPAFLLSGLELFHQKSALSESEFQERAKALRPNVSYRGAIRSVFDGRYKLTRYFAPREHHRPDSWEGLTSLNDLELYDLQSDPNEMNNLAVDLGTHQDLIMTMNEKLNALIDREVGVDDGSFMPKADQLPWSVQGRFNV
jgi:arylsulfatase